MSGSTEKQDPTAPTGKGRPTPTRKEAEAAARERARAGMDKKAAQKLLREKRVESNRKMREGMRTGDERYLPPRDQGPVKRFVRDWVDSRLTFTELIVPIMIVVLILGWTGGGSAKDPSTLTRITGYVQLMTILLIIVDVVLTRVRLTSALKAAFPDQDLPRVTFYAYSRMMAPRFMRSPKATVRIGGAPR